LSTQSEANVPQTLWRLAWTILIAVIIVGTVTLIVLANGAANPHRAGPLTWRHDAVAVSVAANQEHSLDEIALPNAPYTLEITGIMTSANDPGAVWGISFEDSNNPFGIFLNGHRFLSLPPVQSDYRPFIHVRALGQANKITIDVDTDKIISARINDEIAWQGKFTLSDRAHISLKGGPFSDANLQITDIAFYAPQK
jgi:hypothetical protein